LLGATRIILRRQGGLQRHEAFYYFSGGGFTDGVAWGYVRALDGSAR
jgi:hypothetical protein